MKIGIIGSGYIGSTLTQKLSEAGHDVRIADARGKDHIPENLRNVGATIVDAKEVFRDVDVAILSIPLTFLPTIKDIVATVPANATLIDTSNYYPARDQKIEKIEQGKVESVWVRDLFGRNVVKTWNAMGSDSLARFGKPSGTEGRLALPVAGDDADHKQVAIRLLDQIGFDAVDSGSLADSWRHQPGAPAYCTDLTAGELQEALNTAEKPRLPARRDLAVAAIMERVGDGTTNPDAAFLVRLNRALYT